MKKNRLNLNGVIVVNKSKDASSNYILQQLKRLFNAQKAGHTGTLDPMATGVLPICFGRATKIAQYLLDADKEYIATIKLGVETDSGDAEGNIIKESLDDIPKLDNDALENVLDNFRGEISQVPPMYSALKHNGKPLYKLAREGIQIEIKPRDITIYNLDLLDFTEDTITIKVRSSKGTYIRSLAIDIGAKLGCGGHLIALQRTKSGPFDIEQSYTLEQLKDLSFEDKLATISHVESVFSDKLSYTLAEEEKEDLYKRGKFPIRPELNGTVKIYDEDKFVAIAEFDKGELINKRFFDQEILISE
ncbi:tRNA pseudouridine(55) synthase TruB [Francisella adeliensis]|uniref:tRNA pseudouridine synthase B n=1 Tax=Francisella adeliensis TaxID=2007306 RepID=A0A2Z4Y029_9GAMM|nr:tRNA pseudouridine(55) synthase TruB [Francisella adeliensis]AXA34400.1 tRNA pseudouridine(55) synthase TruB [Francisella adeliensis]MBK2086492.1 tRNA pseudouridine(55) synthase TruB [Francisella adeliensis]MBK2096120.1 tRNA pseudouridine(55) synthase TruB [Francisella adeliensis]QIW12646.1 tRNA pseudouridine(55) synthase TruB [Francisella adeliensis]QIW14521.1 tRNA pseudouridine(55) synthase TruB [Francisella adeliensis]